MRNPWLRKNPWMSMWLSGANVVFNTARAHAHRNAAKMMSEGVEQALRAWSAALAPPRTPKRKRSRSR
jgi:hypothetical protein